jgi:signal transduction histidine kinase
VTGWLQQGSLQRRLLVGAVVFILGALVIAGIAIGFVLYRFARVQVDGRLDNQIAAIVADLARDPSSLHLSLDLASPPFDRPLSGWYWQVRRGDTILRSGSLDGHDLTWGRVPSHDDERPKPADGIGPRGETLIVRVLARPLGNGREPTIIAASAPAAALRGPLWEAARILAVTLGILGLCLVAGVIAQVRLGLRPLGQLTRDLAAVRSGALARVPSEQPAEVQPLVDEMNAVLAQNEANLERARAHVANLAHSLKTPLATLTVALGERDPDGSLGRLVGDMDRRVRHHLRRARAAALAGPSRSRIDLSTHAADLAATMARLHAERAVVIELGIPPDIRVACDAQDVDEMLGNLLDNATRWARSRVRVTAARTDRGVEVTVSDDGRGLSDQDMAAVLQRGRRLDESVPGDGFGLSITQELAELYGGGLTLGRSDQGGLCARLLLPH